MTTAPGRLAIEATPSKHRRHGAYRLVHNRTDGEWALIHYSDDLRELEVLRDLLERWRGMRGARRQAQARVLLKALGVSVEDLR